MNAYQKQMVGGFAGLFSVIAAGTAFFAIAEGWSVLDAVYFTVITMATIGYGDFVPTTTLSKFAAMLLMVAGIGVLVYFTLLLMSQNARKK